MKGIQILTEKKKEVKEHGSYTFPRSGIPRGNTVL